MTIDDVRAAAEKAKACCQRQPKQCDELRERLGKRIEEWRTPCGPCAEVGEGLCPHCIESRERADELSALLKEFP